jgi:hypothetical protein
MRLIIPTARKGWSEWSRTWPTAWKDDWQKPAMKMLHGQKSAWQTFSTELAKPFEKEERLTQLLARQREINAALDLDKDNAGAMEAEAEAA